MRFALLLIFFTLVSFSFEVRPDHIKSHCEAFKGSWERVCLYEFLGKCVDYGQYYCKNRYEYQRSLIYDPNMSQRMCKIYAGQWTKKCKKSFLYQCMEYSDQYHCKAPHDKPRYPLDSFKDDNNYQESTKQWCLLHKGSYKINPSTGRYTCYDSQMRNEHRIPLDLKTSMSKKYDGEKILRECCFCIYDQDYRFEKGCAKWFDKQKNCQLEQKISKYEFDKLENSALQCLKSNIFNTSHGVSTEYELPFKISSKIATTFNSEQACYDGWSCLLFDNIDAAQKCAKNLQSDKCNYTISSNQNAGVINLDTCNKGYKSGSTERESASSKLTFDISQTIVRLQFAPCTSKGKHCAYLESPGFQSESVSQNPNIKRCQASNNKVKTQRCCPRKNHKSYHPTVSGYWNQPDSKCPTQ